MGWFSSKDVEEAVAKVKEANDKADEKLDPIFHQVEGSRFTPLYLLALVVVCAGLGALVVVQL